MKNIGRLKVLLVVISVIMGIVFIAGCGGQQKATETSKAGDVQGTVTASGSTALLPLLKPAQEEFQKRHAKVTVNIAGGGSFTGQNQVASGSVNIGNSDVGLQDSLKNQGLVEHKLVGIPFVFIVNPGVTVDSLTQEQYIGIMTGKITNWKEVGGKDQAISIIHRAKSSGSRATIAEVVLKGSAFTDNAVIQDSNGAVRAAISTTPGAVGYVDAAYVDGSVKALAYNGVKYSLDSVQSGKYPVFTFGRMYTKGEPTGAAKAFIEYLTGKEFQESYAEKNGFVPLMKMPK